MYIFEFQKRGLPHAHILLWLDDANKLANPRDIDKVISTELPRVELYPKLSKTVAAFMIHGPWGAARFSSLCMKEGKCSKFYPKKYILSTTIDQNEYPCYRRRDNGIFICTDQVIRCDDVSCTCSGGRAQWNV